MSTKGGAPAQGNYGAAGGDGYVSLFYFIQA
jgi:hypothetical protein